MKKIIELIKQNTYEKKQKEHNSGSLDINKRETHNKRRTNTTNGKIRNKTEKQKLQ